MLEQHQWLEHHQWTLVRGSKQNNYVGRLAIEYFFSSRVIQLTCVAALMSWAFPSFRLTWKSSPERFIEFSSMCSWRYGNCWILKMLHRIAFHERTAAIYIRCARLLSSDWKNAENNFQTFRHSCKSTVIYIRIMFCNINKLYFDPMNLLCRLFHRVWIDGSGWEKQFEEEWEKCENSIAKGSME